MGINDEVAENFAPLRASPFAKRLGALYVRRDASCPVFGMTVEPDLANTNGTGHGGFLAAFVDIAVTRGARMILGADNSIRTLSSNIDFVAPVAVGSWVEATIWIDRAGSRAIFASARLVSEGALVVRAAIVLSTTPSTSGRTVDPGPCPR